MAESGQTMTLESDQLNSTDKAILDELARGRASPRYLAEQADKQQPYVSQRLKRLIEHGHVERVDRGLYELVDRPGNEHTSRYREKAIREYGEVCQGCGTTENVLVHHRDGDRNNNSLSNLIPLCEACHGKVHAGDEKFAELVRELGKAPRDTSTESTTIPISDGVWEELNGQKNRGDTFDDVLRRKLNIGPDSPKRQKKEKSITQPVELPDDLPKTVDEEEARQAIQVVLQFLETEEAASQREIVGAVMPAHSLGYDVPELEKGDRYRGSWWRRIVKPGLELDDRVQKPATGESEWRWKN